MTGVSSPGVSMLPFGENNLHCVLSGGAACSNVTLTNLGLSLRNSQEG